jgi:coenzyme PQQ precursor peptide PqqA
LAPRRAGKGVRIVEWTTPDFEEFETEAEVTAYAYHW